MSRIEDRGKKRIDCAIRDGRLSHALLISGDSHICANIVRYAAAKLFNKSESVVNEVPDFLHADGQALRVASTEELLNEINVTPSCGVRLVAIDNAGRMSVPVQNMLLKTIEEPPHGNHFFLYGNEGGLLPTIRSRCATLTLGQATHEDIAEYLTDASHDDALYYAHLGGTVDEAIRMYEDDEYRGFCMECVSIICCIGKSSLLTDKMRDTVATDAKRATDMFEMAFSDMRRQKLGLKNEFFTRNPHLEQVRECAARFTEKQIDELCSIVRSMRTALFTNAPAKQVFDNFAAKTEQVIDNG